MSASLETRLSCLARANEIRLARARLRAAIARGDVFAASVLLDPPREAQSWRVDEFLSAQRRWGPKRVRRVLLFSFIPETKPLGALTDRQRKVLAEQLEG